MNDVHDALSTQTDQYRIVRELHRIRPHVTYEVRFRGERAVCKIETHPEARLDREAAALQYVDEATSVPVPELLAVGDGHFVARWLDAVPVEPPTRDEERIRTLGRGLATLHAETAPGFDRSGLPNRGVGQLTGDGERWSDTLLGLLERRERYLDTIGYGDLARQVAAVVRENRGLLDGVDDTALLHGNYFGEHVGIEGGDTAAVIDFEHALVGSPEWDYLRTVGPVFGHGTDHGVPEHRFRTAYETVRPLPSGFDERRPLYQLVNGVSYLRSLHLQRGNLDEQQAVVRRARKLAAHVRDRLARFTDGERVTARTTEE